MTGAIQHTDAQGIARVGEWVIGLTPGENALIAATGGVPPTRFTAQGVPGVAASLAATSAADASGLVGNFLAITPSVRVTDAAGHVVAGVEVTFEVVSGGGTVASAAMQSFGLARSRARSPAPTSTVMRPWQRGGSGRPPERRRCAPRSARSRP